MNSDSEEAFVRGEVVHPDDDGIPHPSHGSTGNTSNLTPSMPLPNTSSVSPSSLPTTNDDVIEYANIKLNHELWMQRIQDTGYSYDMLP